MSLRPNDQQRCPSRARRKHHRAHGEVCLRCEPDTEWTAECPICLDRVPAVGTIIQRHALSYGDAALPCPGVGEVVHPPQRVESSWPLTRLAQRIPSVAVLAEGAA